MDRTQLEIRGSDTNWVSASIRGSNMGRVCFEIWGPDEGRVYSGFGGLMKARFAFCLRVLVWEGSIVGRGVLEWARLVWGLGVLTEPWVL